MCVFVCALCLYSASPGWDVRYAFVCAGSGLGCTPPFLVRVFACVWLFARFACTLPVLAGVRGACVSVWDLAFTLPIPGWVLGPVCLFERSACTPPVLAGACRVRVCAWVQVLASLCHSWLWCGGACVCVPVPPVQRRSWLAFVVRVFCFGFWLSPCQPWLGCWCVCLHVSAPSAPRQSCLGCAVRVSVHRFACRLRPATPGWGVEVCVSLCALRVCPASPGCSLRCAGWVLPGTFSRAVVRCVL